MNWLLQLVFLKKKRETNSAALFEKIRIHTEKTIFSSGFFLCPYLHKTSIMSYGEQPSLTLPHFLPSFSNMYMWRGVDWKKIFCHLGCSTNANVWYKTICQLYTRRIALYLSLMAAQRKFESHKNLIICIFSLFLGKHFFVFFSYEDHHLFLEPQSLKKENCTTTV